MGRVKRETSLQEKEVASDAFSLSPGSFCGRVTGSCKCIVTTGDPRSFLEKYTSDTEQCSQWAAVANDVFRYRHPPEEVNWTVALLERGQFTSGLRATSGSQYQGEAAECKSVDRGATCKPTGATWSITSRTDLFPAPHPDASLNFNETRGAGLLRLLSTVL